MFWMAAVPGETKGTSDERQLKTGQRAALDKANGTCQGYGSPCSDFDIPAGMKGTADPLMDDGDVECESGRLGEEDVSLETVRDNIINSETISEREKLQMIETVKALSRLGVVTAAQLRGTRSTVNQDEQEQEGPPHVHIARLGVLRNA